MIICISDVILANCVKIGLYGGGRIESESNFSLYGMQAEKLPHNEEQEKQSRANRVEEVL